jgi:1-acyl-sn-glycerol-3-phosphate acyltransferase
MHLVSDYKVIGRENLPPKNTPFILVGNHLSYLDVPAMGGAMDRNTPAFAAKKYRGTLFGLLFYLGAPVWIEQSSPDRAALTQALKILKAGHPFAIAPEGTRSRTGALQEGKDGTAFLVSRTDYPIVPVVVYGVENIFKQWRPQVRVVIGKPFYLPQKRAKDAELTEYTERIMCAMAALLPEKYHGYYAGNPLIEEMAQLVR